MVQIPSVEVDLSVTVAYGVYNSTIMCEFIFYLVLSFTVLVLSNVILTITVQITKHRTVLSLNLQNVCS